MAIGYEPRFIGCLGLNPKLVASLCVTSGKSLNFSCLPCLYDSSVYSRSDCEDQMSQCLYDSGMMMPVTWQAHSKCQQLLLSLVFW